MKRHTVNETINRERCVLRPHQVDFWNPENPNAATLFSEVDIRIPAAHIDMVLVMLQQSGMEYQ